ncbi:C-4 sterol methyl oxidase [Thelotrema lepadinum]|nr:C-4 sterol methyl oxidase [Thelotrema lepadinum]
MPERYATKLFFEDDPSLCRGHKCISPTSLSQRIISFSEDPISTDLAKSAKATLVTGSGMSRFLSEKPFDAFLLQLPPRHPPLHHLTGVVVATLTAAMTFNATLVHSLSPPDTYWENYNLISQYNVHLNFFEKLWAAWYAYMQNDVLATGIMSFVMHEAVYVRILNEV